MKKLLSICLAAVTLCACSGKSWENKVGISDLKVEENMIIGKIQNKTDRVVEAELAVIGKNGSLEVERTCTIALNPEFVEDLECYAYDFEDDYEVILKDVKVTEYPTFYERNFQDGDTLTADDFRVYFNGAMEACTRFNSSVYRDAVDVEYPYVEECTYYQEDDTAHVTNFGMNGKTNVFSDTYWNRYSGRIEMGIVMLGRNDDTESHFQEVVDQVRMAFILDCLSGNAELYHTKIYSALKNPVELGYGYEYGGYVYGYTEELDDNGELTKVTFAIYKSK